MHLLVVPRLRDVVSKAAKVLLYHSMPSCCHNYHVVRQVLVISLDQSILAANTN